MCTKWRLWTSVWVMGIWLFVCVSVVFPQQRQVFGPFVPYEKSHVWLIEQGHTNYALPDSFLIQNSEALFVNDTLRIRNVDYTIDYINGIVTWKLLWPQNTPARMTYHILPIGLRKSYSRHRLKPLADSERRIYTFPPERTREEIKARRSNLRKNGSIVRGVSLGSNQGLKVESGLRMNISGRITENVEVIAALTDQTTPIQPEGNSQTLNEIDKIFVQIKSDRYQATMGDYYLQFDGSEFGRYNRKLQGAMGIANLQDHKVTLSAAVSKGKYTTNQFSGLEGNQGPYQLKGDQGQIDIIVLAGTEKVWIDGQQMTRGENNDYIIEYSNGQITFTRHRLITSDSRITVDFQYSDLKYQRSLYGVHSQSSFWGGNVKLDMRVIREADNKVYPLDFTLSDDMLRRLEDAGDLIDSAFVDGARYVGEGKGSYV